MFTRHHESIWVAADSGRAAQTLRNICAAHDETVCGRYGRSVLFDPTELGAFLAFRMQLKHTDEVDVGRVVPLDEGDPIYRRSLLAASAYEEREQPHTPYPKFAAGRELPSKTTMRKRRV